MSAATRAWACAKDADTYQYADTHIAVWEHAHIYSSMSAATRA